MGCLLPIDGQFRFISQGLAAASCATSVVARRKPMPDPSVLESLNQAIQQYFDLMYDNDTARFSRVFRSTAQLHGFREGVMAMRPAQTYREILDQRPSPKSLNAPRDE